MEWTITITVGKRKAVHELLLAMEALDSMESQEVRIERWDRKQLLGAEIRRQSLHGHWIRWQWDGRGWVLDDADARRLMVSVRPTEAAKRRGWSWRPPRRRRRKGPSKARRRMKLPG
jgi:hypothetical protein